VRLWPRVRLPWTLAVVAVVLAAARLALTGIFLSDSGFESRYFANDEWRPPHEHAVAGLARSVDRTPELAFGRDAPRDLPLYFFNDNARFNYYQPTEPDRGKLPFSARWTGYFHQDTRGDRIVRLRARGAWAEIAVDDRRIVRTTPTELDVQAPVSLDLGWRRIVVSLSAPYGAERSFQALEQSGDGRERPLGRAVFVRPIAATRRHLTSAARAAVSPIDALIHACVIAVAAAFVAWAWRARRIVPLLWLTALTDAVVTAMPAYDRVILLGGGDDPLTYETLARDIAGNGPLMTLGARLGQGEPFYYQPLYSYFIALTHIISGEHLFGALFAQRLLLYGAAFATARTARLLFGAAAGWTTLAVGGVWLLAVAGRWSQTLFTEALFVPLAAFWAMLLVETATTPSTRKTIAAGLIGGLSTLARSTLLLAWPIVLALWTAALKGCTTVAGRRAALAALVMSLTVLVATARNVIVSNQFVLVTSSLPANLYIGNEPPSSVDPRQPRLGAVSRALRLDERTAAVLEYAAQAPRAFARHLARKAAYALGFFGWSGLPAARGVGLAYVLVWVGAVIGIARQWPHGAGTAMRLIPLAIGVSQLAVSVLVFPHIHEGRLILPAYALLLPYAALAVTPLVAHMTSAAVRLPPPTGAWLVLCAIYVGGATISAIAAPGAGAAPRWRLQVAFAVAVIASAWLAQLPGVRKWVVRCFLVLLVAGAAAGALRVWHAAAPWALGGIASLAVATLNRRRSIDAVAWLSTAALLATAALQGLAAAAVTGELRWIGWLSAWRAIAARPFVGGGDAHARSMLLQLAVDAGVITAAAFAALLVGALVVTLRRAANRHHATVHGALLAFWLNGVTENPIAAPGGVAVLMAVGVAVGIAYAGPRPPPSATPT
jgi:hypothetical protein